VDDLAIVTMAVELGDRFAGNFDSDRAAAQAPLIASDMVSFPIRGAPRPCDRYGVVGTMTARQVGRERRRQPLRADG
jgi:hypothetical protein